MESIIHLPKKCKACSGTGITPIEKDPWNTIIQHAVKCPACKGTGIAPEKEIVIKKIKEKPDLGIRNNLNKLK